MRLITWNINSVRARIGIVEQLVKIYQPDVLCLQETKVQDHQFPRKAFQEMGFETVAIKGQKSHHGVATLVRGSVTAIESIDWCQMGDARHVAVTMENGISVHNFYVPAGGDEPDRTVNDKFGHKLDFVSEMTDWSRSLEGEAVLVGDLNIAPLEHDVWSSKALKKVVSHTPIEREAMLDLMKAGDWQDVMRDFVGEEEKLYTWWSYRARDWRAADKGRRLDHIWTTPGMKGKARTMQVIKDARGWEKPSDHAPVMVDFDL